MNRVIECSHAVASADLMHPNLPWHNRPCRFPPSLRERR